jgi:hypothetical protein
MHFLQYWVQEHHLLCSRTVTKNTMMGWTFEGYKISGDCGYLIKEPTVRQCVNCVTFQKHRQDQEPERHKGEKECDPSIWGSIQYLQESSWMWNSKSAFQSHGIT